MCIHVTVTVRTRANAHFHTLHGCPSAHERTLPFISFYTLDLSPFSYEIQKECNQSYKFATCYFQSKYFRSFRDEIKE